MIHIALDTNTLRQEGLNSTNMRILKRMVKENLITIYIPEIVLNEFKTQKYNDLKKALNTRELHNAIKLFNYDSDMIRNLLEPLKIAIDDIYNTDINHSYDIEVEDWIKDFEINILKFDKNKIEKVMDDYFKGKGVFKTPKNRNDIPDSMICTSIEDLHTEKKKTYVLTNDNQFATYLKTIKNIYVYDTLKSFYKIDSIKEKIEELNTEIKEHDLLEEIFLSKEFYSVLLKYLKNEENLINSMYFEEDMIYEIDDLNFAEHLHATEINYPNALDIEQFKINSFEFLSDNEFSFGLSFITTAELKIGMEGYDYFKLESNNFYNRNIELYNMKSDGYCVITENRKFEFKVNYNISIDENTNKKEVFLNLENQIGFSDEIEEIKAISINDFFQNN